MNKLGLFGAAAVASALCFGAAPAMAAGEVSGAALDLVTAQTNTGNGGSFVTRAVKDAFPWQNAQFTTWFEYNTLSAAKWYTAITTNTHVVEVSNIADIEADLIMAINEVKNSSGTVTYGGHAVVIVGDPIDITDEYWGPVVSGTKQWALPIADSTSSAHGNSPAYYDGVTDYSDSRWTSDPETGAWSFTGSRSGTAYMRLYADETTGEIFAHAWSVTATSEANVFDQTEKPFAIGECTL